MSKSTRLQNKSCHFLFHWCHTHFELFFIHLRFSFLKVIRVLCAFSISYRIFIFHRNKDILYTFSGFYRFCYKTIRLLIIFNLNVLLIFFVPLHLKENLHCTHFLFQQFLRWFLGIAAIESLLGRYSGGSRYLIIKIWLKLKIIPHRLGKI